MPGRSFSCRACTLEAVLIKDVFQLIITICPAHFVSYCQIRSLYPSKAAGASNFGTLMNKYLPQAMRLFAETHPVFDVRRALCRQSFP